MTAAERALLRAVFAWARANVWRLAHWNDSGYRSWVAGHSSVGLGVAGRSTAVLDISQPGRAASLDVRSVAEAVDLLCAIRILPAHFSTAYRAGWYAHVQGADGNPMPRPAAWYELVGG